MITTNKFEQSNRFSKEKLKEIEVHKNIAAQLAAASELHLIAATHIENDDHVQAFNTVINAYGILGLARECQKIILDDSLYGQVSF